MTRITIYRSDFGGHVDSEGTPYFEYLARQLGQEITYATDMIEIDVEKCRFFDDDGLIIERTL